MFARTRLALWALILGACTTTSPAGSFKVPREEFLARTRTLLVFPLEGAEFRAEDLSRIDAEVAETLERFGYRVVDADDYPGQAGPVDSVLYKGLIAREAFFTPDGAEWDGVNCDVGLPSSGLYGLDDDVEGQLAGMSLFICITRPDGEILFESFGGIGLLHRWEGTKFENIDPKQVLAEPAAARKAVKVALAALAR